jgi:hypothetical protein
MKSCLCALIFIVLPMLARAGGELKISWTNNLLTISGARLPAGKLEVWYLEAFCRSGAWGRDWSKTTLPHKTTLTWADPAGQHLKFRTSVEPNIQILHEIQVAGDGLELRFELLNQGKEPVDLQWFQPACIRVENFTGCQQSNYTARSFIFTSTGLTALDQLRRTTNALYPGGQVYLPGGVAPADANPRPICGDHPVNGLIGCFSADNHWLLATASNRTHELFEGVYVCLHSDPEVGGLAPGQTKRVLSKVYFLPNDPQALLQHYRHDFPKSVEAW